MKEKFSLKKFKKFNLLLLFGLSMVFLVGCNSSNGVNGNGVTGDSTLSDTKVILTGELKEINVEAFKFGFEPDVIEVNYGDKVKIIGKSRDVPHGLAIPEFGVNLYLDGLREDSAEFIADKRGEFTFYCSTPCGRGHGSMKGTFIVK